MAKNNVVVAVSTETRERLNELVKNLNKSKGQNERELTAKDFIQQAVEYFERNNIDPTSDVVAAPRQDQSGTTDKALLDKLDSILKLTADNALKVTAIGQGMNQGFADLRTTIETKQKRLPKELTDEEKEIMKTKEQLLSDIGQIFKFWRLRAKLNRNEMAKRMGVTYNAISRIEEGKDTNLSTALLYIDRMNEIDSSLDFWTLFMNYRGKATKWQSKKMADNIQHIIQRTLESGEYTKDEENVEIYGIIPDNNQ